MIKTLPFHSLHEVVYHVWYIKAGHRTYIYSGDADGLKKAVDRVWKEYGMKPKIQKVM